MYKILQPTKLRSSYLLTHSFINRLSITAYNTASHTAAFPYLVQSWVIVVYTFPAAWQDF
jgi:hypothetical protein